jgi:hypothetical protein
LDAANVLKDEKSRRWLRSTSRNSQKTDVGCVQRPRNRKIRTLTGANVFFVSISGRCFRPMSGKPQNRDVDRNQRLKNAKKKTLVVTNVKKFLENGR